MAPKQPVKKQDTDTRYYLDIDIASRKVIRWDFEQKQNLNKGKSPSPGIHRVFLTLGQYNKFREAMT